MQQESITVLHHIEIQKLMLNRTATWNDMKFQRSRIVFNANHALNIKDQAEPFAAVVASYRASPKRSRSKQSNESAVITSCTSLAQFSLAEWLENLPNLKNSKEQENT